MTGNEIQLNRQINELHNERAEERLATRRLLVELMCMIGEDAPRTQMIEMIGQHLGLEPQELDNQTNNAKGS